MRLIQFDSLPSTNQYCELLDLTQSEEFTIIAATEQTAGIGQRGNRWESQKGENLTFSIILKPTFLPIADQYQLTKAISLGIADWLEEVLPHPEAIRIKWPNDIYVGNRKICGTLTSTKVNASGITAAIIGIGMNVNQTHFPDWVPNPTSLKIITGQRYDTQPLLASLAAHLSTRYEQLRNQLDAPDAEYLERLLYLGQQREYSHNGHTITATINGVNRFGHLMLTTATGESLVCQMKEIGFIIA